MEIADRLRQVQERIAVAAARVGRDPDDIILVAVTKTMPVEVIQEGYRLGLRHFGENRVEEGMIKIPQINEWAADDPPTWHMVGHVQSRKARNAVLYFDVVHSVDRLKLARRLSRFAGEAGKRIPVLLEVNTSGEASKYGYPADDEAGLFVAVEAMRELPNIEIQGLMTMAPIVTDPEDARPYFRRLRELRDALQARFPDLNWHHLSMGMTDDFEVAIEEGATMIRLGRAIFGPRRE